MGATPTGSILINLVDGTRQPLPANVQWSAIIRDGRSPNAWHEAEVNGSGSAELVKNLAYFDYLFDKYTAIVSAKGYQGAAWMPVHIFPVKPASLDLMRIPEGGDLNFSGASWQTLNSVHPHLS